MHAVVTPGGPTPTGSNSFQEQHHVQFQGFIFQVTTFAEQEISLSFNEIASNKIHEALHAQLKSINCKTVLAALKKEFDAVVKGNVERRGESYALIVTVQYEFLPPIEETIQFTPRVVTDKEMSELEIKNYFHEVKTMKQEMAKIANCEVTTFNLEDKKEYMFPYPKDKSLLTWSIQAKGLSSSLKLSISYFDSSKRIEKKTKLIPSDNVSVYAPRGEGSVEMRFLIEPSKEFDQIVFRIDSKVTGKFMIITERV